MWYYLDVLVLCAYTFCLDVHILHVSSNICRCGSSSGSAVGSEVGSCVAGIAVGIVVGIVVASDSFDVVTCTAASSEVERYTVVDKVGTVAVVVQMVVVRVVEALKAFVASDSMLRIFHSFVQVDRAVVVVIRVQHWLVRLQEVLVEYLPHL